MESTVNNEVNIQEESFLAKHTTLVIVLVVFLHVSLFVYVVRYRNILNYSNPFDAILPFFLIEFSVPFIIFLLGVSNFYGKRKEIFRGLLWSLVFILAPIILFLLPSFVIFGMGMGGGH